MVLIGPDMGAFFVMRLYGMYKKSRRRFLRRLGGV